MRKFSLFYNIIFQSSFEIHSGEYLIVNKPPELLNQEVENNLVSQNNTNRQSEQVYMCRNKRENFRGQLGNDQLKRLFSQNREKSMKKNMIEPKGQNEAQKYGQNFSQNNYQRRGEVDIVQEEDGWDSYNDIYKTFQIYSSIYLYYNGRGNGNNQQEGKTQKKASQEEKAE